jgi:hypothetical protein
MQRLIILCSAILGLTAMLQADTWNKKTELTVNETIQVPGATLSPGKYVVKLVDSQANRHIVQFMNEREDQVISTVLAIPNQRLQPTGDSEFTFYESSAGEAPALRAWFYPGDNFGQQFAYPEQKAMLLARATGEKVPTAPAQTRTTESSTTTTTRTQPAAPPPQLAERVERAEPPLMAQAQPKPATPPATPRQEPAPAPRDPAPAPKSDDADDLPATASGLPLLGLMGLLSLGAALGIQHVSKRRIS